MRPVKKADFIIILIALVIMLGVMAGYKVVEHLAGDERVVEIRYAKNVIYEVELTNETNLEILVVDGQIVEVIDRHVNPETPFTIPKEGKYNIVKIYNNGIQVIEANCEEQIDVHQGFVNQLNRSIICAPHHLEVIIVARDSGDDLPDFDREL